MMRFATWKVALILAMTFIAFLICIPSMIGPEYRARLASVLPSWLPPNSIVLGLDLQGGAHLLYEVDRGDVIRSMTGNLRDDLRRLVREEKIAISGGIGVNPRGVQVRIPDAAERARIMPKLYGLVQLSAGPGGSGLDITDAGDG